LTEFIVANLFSTAVAKPRKQHQPSNPAIPDVSRLILAFISLYSLH
jgi:hypothetical protein